MKKKIKEEYIYPVYARGSALGCRPLFMATGEERKEMLANGSAKTVSRGKALQLLLVLPQLRGQSCQMGWRLVIAALLGSRLAKVAAASYRFGAEVCAS